MHYVKFSFGKKFCIPLLRKGKTFQGYISGRGALQLNLHYSYLRAEHSFCGEKRSKMCVE